MVAGRKPKPAKLRLLEGARPHKVNRAEPVPRPDPPDVPAWLEGEVAQVWEFTVGELEAMGLATQTDQDALHAFCEAVVLHRQASRLLAKADIIVKGSRGQAMQHPAIVIQRQAAATIRAYATEFGLTPSARARIQVKTERIEDDNPFAGSGS